MITKKMNFIFVPEVSSVFCANLFALKGTIKIKQNNRVLNKMNILLQKMLKPQSALVTRT